MPFPSLRRTTFRRGSKKIDEATSKVRRSESGSTEVRKERSEGTLRKKYRRGAKPLD